MANRGWLSLEDRGQGDLAQAVVTWGRVRLERGDQEFVLVAELNHGNDGRIKDVRVALRRAGGAFIGPQGSFPAVGTIYDSVAVSTTTPATSLHDLGLGDRSRVRQAAKQILDRSGRRIDEGR
jgi:hypothetical protein